MIYIIASNINRWHDDGFGAGRMNRSETDPAKLSEQQIAAMLDEYERNNWIVGDFVLTKAAVPIDSNAILPVEGFRMTKADEQGNAFFIIAAISAEKMWTVIKEFVGLLGDQAQIAIVDMGSDPDKIIDYVSDEMDAYAFLTFLEQHRSFFLNNGMLEVCFFSRAGGMELRVDSYKHFQFATHDPVPVVDLLIDNNIRGNQDIKFFPQGPALLSNPVNSDEELEAMLEKLTIIQTNYYNKEQTS